jgi:hypothetical protein
MAEGSVWARHRKLSKGGGALRLGGGVTPLVRQSCTGSRNGPGGKGRAAQPPALL